MKLDRTEKGALTSVMDILPMVFVGIIYEDLRHDPSVAAQYWQDIMLGLMLLGMAIFVGGAGIVYSTPVLTHK